MPTKLQAVAFSQLLEVVQVKVRLENPFLRCSRHVLGFGARLATDLAIPTLAQLLLSCNSAVDSTRDRRSKCAQSSGPGGSRSASHQPSAILPTFVSRRRRIACRTRNRRSSKSFNVARQAPSVHHKSLLLSISHRTRLRLQRHRHARKSTSRPIRSPRRRCTRSPQMVRARSYIRIFEEVPALNSKATPTPRLARLVVPRTNRSGGAHPETGASTGE